MDLLDRLLGHDAWTTALLLGRARELTDAQLDEALGIGPGSLRATLAHTVWNTETWSALMAGEELTRLPDAPSLDAVAELHQSATARLAVLARGVAARDGWDETWLDTWDDPPATRTFGGAIAHVLTHSMHHRAQIIHMLRRHGLTDLPEGDALTWESQLGEP